MSELKKNKSVATPKESQIPAPQPPQDQQAPQAPQANENPAEAPVVKTETQDANDINVKDAVTETSQAPEAPVVETAKEEIPEQIEFVKKVLPSEKLHYENIINSQKKTIAALRSENIELHQKIKKQEE